MSAGIPREYGQSGGSFWQPYKGSIDLDGFRLSVTGSKQCQFGSNDVGTITVEVLNVRQKGKTRAETTKEVLKFDYERSNGSQHLVLDPKPMKLVPKIDDDGKIKRELATGGWQKAFSRLSEQSWVEFSF